MSSVRRVFADAGLFFVVNWMEVLNMAYPDQTGMGGAQQAFLTTQWSLIENIQDGKEN